MTIEHGAGGIMKNARHGEYRAKMNRGKGWVNPCFSEKNRFCSLTGKYFSFDFFEGGR